MENNKNHLNGTVDYIGVKWHAGLHEGIDEKFEKISLKGVSSLRQFVNSTAMDVFYWLSPTYRNVIVEEVLSKLNEEYEIYIEKYPDFSGQVSIIAHSLGTVICHYILCRQRVPVIPLDPPGNLDVLRNHLEDLEHENAVLYTPRGAGDSLVGEDLPFSVKNLFLIGSPLGMFQVAGGMEIFHTHQIPKCNNIFNIVHPCDPVAYRIEPWIDSRYSDIPPAKVPSYKSSKKIVNDMSSKFRGHHHKHEHVVLGKSRYDYQLSDHSISEYGAMVNAHRMYWLSKDVLLFILNKICKN
eukprot:TRINITY_DN2373_c1_g4_i1.p1 TRINITY_DN2373_c1_g4~~TRINITY_DN2373_c1_g4_i1.p1  ORF type:complete len:338 (+),score=76.94 TRINITY_DN2373_c1_g4_i1:127-1014(+)